jgi:hypothetical protein
MTIATRKSGTIRAVRNRRFIGTPIIIGCRPSLVFVVWLQPAISLREFKIAFASRTVPMWQRSPSWRGTYDYLAGSMT